MKRFILTISIVGSSLFASAQQVGINTATPDNSAVLDIVATDKGLLLPRVSLVNITNTTTPINTPTNGLFVYNTNALTSGGKGIGIYVFNGTNWEFVRHGTVSLDGCYDYIGNGTGRTIIADAGAVRIEGTDGIWVTGTHGAGATITSEITGAGTRMFYNPQKSAFRAGTVTGIQFDQNRVGNFSGAFGLDNAIYGGRNFGAGYNNITSNVNASSLGLNHNSYDNAALTLNNNNTAGGNNALSINESNTTGGYHALSAGYENNANTINEIAIGYFSRNKGKTVDTGSGASFDQLTDSASNFYNTDGLFVIGNGTDNSNRHDAVSIMKDGIIEINQQYNLSLVDGITNQVVATDGNGNLGWTDKIIEPNVSQITLYADDQTYSLSNTSYSNLGNIVSAIIPTEYEPSGNIQIRLLIKYASNTGTTNIRLRDHLGNNIITNGMLTNVTTVNGGVLYSSWQNYSSVNPVAVNLNGLISSGTMNIETVYLLIKAQ